MATITVPTKWRDEARQFVRNFSAASASWIAQGHYSASDVETLRGELVGIINGATDSEDCDAVLGFWFGLVSRMARETA